VIDRVTAVAAAQDALARRAAIVFVHLVSARGIETGGIGLRAIYESGQGLSHAVATPRIDEALAREAAGVLASGHPRAVNLGADGTPATRRDRVYARFLLDPIVATPRLLIVGAGHIAVPLARLASVLEFETIVIDERADFANRERFPTADEVHARPFDEFLDEFEVDERTHVVLVTRAHRFDEMALRRLLGSPAPYIGMIGSRRRVHIVYGTLLAEGYGPEQFAKVYAPIGLDIGARTPAEIAIAIAAEIVDLRRHGQGRRLSLREFRPEVNDGR
jgi:xanthine dehydrogenase accessory factor